MPIKYGNANYRKKFDAFLVVDKSGHEPLKEAIACALRLRENAKLIEKVLDNEDLKPETKAQLTISLNRCTPDEFNAWIKIAEFIYAKPKQQHELSGELILKMLAVEANVGR